MTIREYSKILADKLRGNPTKAQAEEIANSILSFQVNGQGIDDDQIDLFLKYLDKELKNFQPIMGGVDNREILIYMDLIKQLIDQKQKKSKSETNKE